MARVWYPGTGPWAVSLTGISRTGPSPAASARTSASSRDGGLKEGYSAGNAARPKTLTPAYSRYISAPSSAARSIAAAAATRPRRGRRAAQALEVLEKAGFKRLFHLKGDFARWSAEERPVLKPL